MFILTYCLHNLIRNITSFWVMQFGCSGYNFQVNILKTKSDRRLVFYETFTPNTRNRINMSNQEILYLTSEVNRNHIRDNDVSSKVEIQRFLFCLLFSPPPVKPEGTIGLHSVRPSLCLSVCPSHSFSRIFFAMLSHIWMKVGSKILYEELQIEFNFRHGWAPFSWVIALCSKFVFRTFLHSAFTYRNESW